MDRGDLDSPTERRREPRHVVAFDARTAVVFLGEEADATLTGKGIIENLSVNGACVNMQDLQGGQIFSLKTVGRNCWVFCKVLDGKEVSFLSGQIAWIHIQADRPEPNARIGVSLVDTAPNERKRRMDYLQHLAHGL